MGRPVDRKCSCYKCSNPILLPMNQAIMGICKPHYEKAMQEDSFIGICWNCCKVTAVASRQGIIKDKYIFSKGCRYCTGDEKMNISWMTINKNSQSITSVVIDDDGMIRFVPTALLEKQNKLEMQSSQITSHPLNRIKSGSPPKRDVKPRFVW